MLMLLNNNYRLRYLLLELFNAFFFFFLGQFSDGDGKS